MIFYLLQKVALKVHEVIGFHNVWAAFTTEHSGEEGLHGWWSRPSAHHEIGNLQN